MANQPHLGVGQVEEGNLVGEVVLQGLRPRGHVLHGVVLLVHLVVHAVARMTDGEKYRIALLLKSTPLHALEELGKTNEVMPPKSTYFFPKLATGMVLNPLE